VLTFSILVWYGSATSQDKQTAWEGSTQGL
jgi:hypothetical protein